MSGFITVTHQGKPYLINIARIEAVYENDEGMTEVNFVGEGAGCVEVEESVVAVSRLIRENSIPHQFR